MEMTSKEERMKMMRKKKKTQRRRRNRKKKKNQIPKENQRRVHLQRSPIVKTNEIDECYLDIITS